MPTGAQGQTGGQDQWVYLSHFAFNIMQNSNIHIQISGVGTYSCLLQVCLLCHLHCLFDLLIGGPLSLLGLSLTGPQRAEHGHQLIPLSKTHTHKHLIRFLKAGIDLTHNQDSSWLASWPVETPFNLAVRNNNWLNTHRDQLKWSKEPISIN